MANQVKRLDRSQRALQVVQQATAGKDNHQIIERDSFGAVEGSFKYIIKCSCGETIEGEAPALGAAKRLAQQSWQEHVEG